MLQASKHGATGQPAFLESLAEVETLLKAQKVRWGGVGGCMHPLPASASSPGIPSAPLLAPPVQAPTGAAATLGSGTAAAAGAAASAGRSSGLAHALEKVRLPCK